MNSVGLGVVDNFTWHAANVTVSLVAFRTTTVRAVVRVDADGIMGTGVVYIAWSLTCVPDAGFGQGTIVVVGATH